MSAEPLPFSSHVDQSVPYEWRAFEYGDETLIAYENQNGLPICYRVVGTTRNVRTLAHVDALLYEGNVVEPIYEPETRSVVFQHSWAGRMGRRSVVEWLAEPAVTLDRLPTGTLTGGDRDV